MDSRTLITGISDDTPEVIYQTLHTKTSWRGLGIITTMLLRTQHALRDEGSPTLQGTFTKAGWGIASHMHQAHGWTIIGSPPPPAAPRSAR